MDKTIQLDRIYNKTVPREFIFEIFREKKCVFLFRTISKKDRLCATRARLQLTPFGQCYFALFQAVSQPLYPFGHGVGLCTLHIISQIY